MPRTSTKPEEILKFVNEFVQENGYSPSVREIGEAVGLRSTASVSYHLQALQAKGFLGGAQACSGRRRTPRPDTGGRGGNCRAAHPGAGKSGGNHGLG